MDRIDPVEIHTEDNEIISESTAIRRREWLSVLMGTGNEKVLAAYKKYEKINPAPIIRPGFKRNTEIWAGNTSPLTVEELSEMSNPQIAEYIINFKETDVFQKTDPTERGLAQVLEKCVEANPQKFADNLLPFIDLSTFYQSSLLHGILKAWRNGKPSDWFAVFDFIRKILSVDHFWNVEYRVGFNYRNWILSTAADLISVGTKDDEHAFDTQLLPHAEEILLILVKKSEPNIFAPTDSTLNVLSSNRGRVFSAMINYSLRFARINQEKLECYRWPVKIRTAFTNRLDRDIEPSLEFSYMLGFFLPNLAYLDKDWVVDNIDRIFPLDEEHHWQAAFSGYLIYSRVSEEFYSLLKSKGHYHKAMNADFADNEVVDRLVRHICTGWIKDYEDLSDKSSLIYQLIHNRNPSCLNGIVYFFSRRADKLSEKVKAKVIPAWGALFGVLSRYSNQKEYEAVLSPLAMWLGLIDEINDEVFSWIKVSMNCLDKVPGYAYTLSRVIEALQRHVLTTPEYVGKIYLEIPESEMWLLGQTQKDEVVETVRILYKKGYKDMADEICNKFGKEGVDFLRSVYEESKL